MSEQPSSAGARTSQFGHISTRASIVAQPQAILRQYGKAIRGYLDALLGTDDAEDVAGEVAVKILRGDFADWAPGKGRFRDYLKTAVRNAAFDFMRKSGRARRVKDLNSLPDPASPAGPSADVWLNHWRSAVLAGALEKLKAYQDRRPGNVYCTVVRLLEEAPGANSRELARWLTEATGRSYRPDNARKQTERARRQFAELLVEEVCLTLDEPTLPHVTEELQTLGLLPYVAGSLPARAQTSGPAVPRSE
jgi:hypothetical protein